MKYVGQQNIKKLCNFYVSDLHLSVMLLPYISKQINEDVEITTIFEKIKKENIEAILEKMNVKNKNEILKINWLNNTNEKIKKVLDDSITNNKKVTIIIGGNEKYVTDNNNYIKDYIKEKNYDVNLKIIDCYNVEEVGINMKSIVKKYDGILNTCGETKISNL
ncbi:MAG: hypothetical protein IJ890_06565 [Clostridia bacterium]|nr:hypothetical protein [Clostridia bacterium]